MKIAYLIQAHKNFQQLETLISCLSQSDDHACFVHIDRKNELLYLQLSEKYFLSPKVHIIEDRVIVNWSGFSQVEATLLLMRNVHCSNIRFDRI
ncbi:MAG: hypothetical protein IE880_02635, partial [Epsilonproteobacteria bacterium]|nr:hypothetical protein [Campylobacterota bacterium]